MISCNQYDHIEIVCMYKHPIRLTRHSGEVIECTALDTLYNSAREECIKVKHEGSDKEVILDKIAKLEVSITPPTLNKFLLVKAFDLKTSEKKPECKIQAI